MKRATSTNVQAGPHLTEALRVRTGRLAPLPNAGEHHPSPDDVGQRAAGLRQRLLDDIKAADRLPVHIAARRGAAVGRDRRGTRNADVGPRAHGAGKADLRFKRRARGHQPTGSSHARSMPEPGAARGAIEISPRLDPLDHRKIRMRRGVHGSRYAPTRRLRWTFCAQGGHRSDYVLANDGPAFVSQLALTISRQAHRLASMCLNPRCADLSAGS